MTQRFIKLGEGYGDTFELFTLVESMPDRVEQFLIFNTEKNEAKRRSIAVVFKPTNQGNFQPIYICLEGIPQKEKEDLRIVQFRELAEKLNKQIIEMDVPSSNSYFEEELYFQKLIAILRLNHLIKPL